jgi:hypothetical protein
MTPPLVLAVMVLVAIPALAAAARCATIGWHPLATSGTAIPAAAALPWAALYSRDALQPVLNADASPAVSEYPDAVTFHQISGTSQIAMVSHTEFAQPGGLWLTTLSRSPSSGLLTPSAARPIDVASVNGVGIMCAGSVFGASHLGGEEYPQDCRANPSASADTARWYGYYTGSAASSLPNPPNKGDYDNSANRAAVDALYSCYNMGAVVQATPYSKKVGSRSSSTRQLDARVTKLRTIGRFSREQATVAPDRRTVLSTADDKMGLLAMFVADKPGDLTKGLLYAAKFTNQQGGDGVTGLGTTWDVSWVLLGRGDQRQLDALASDPSLKFGDIFETAEPDLATLTCPQGFSHANTYGYLRTQTGGSGTQRYMECLKVRQGREREAAFFETQRYAAMLGATTEFEKLEGVTFSKELKKWYVACATVARGMLDGATNGYRYDYGPGGNGGDGLQLSANRCGVVIELGGFATSGSKAWQPTTARVVLAGTPLASPPDSDGNSCDVNGIAGPDNLLVVPGTSTLLVAEDTGDHRHNVLWAAELSASPPTLTRLVSAPLGAEVTGLSAATIGAHGYLPLAFQHPSGGVRASAGYLGPFPKAALTPLPRGKGARPLVFEGVAAQNAGSAAGEGAVVATGRVCY